MKSSKPITIFLAFFLFALSAFAQEATDNQFPFYVRLTQAYQYPGTDLASTAGMIEQVVAESLGDYVLSAPIGITVKIPKSLTVRVSDQEAADGLLAERVTQVAQMKQAIDFMQQMAEANKKLLAEREQIMQAIQSDVAARQQQSTGSSAQDLRDELKAIRGIQELMKNRRR